MKTIKYSDFIELSEFKKFRELAENFFVLIEQETELDNYDFRCELHQKLAELYTQAWKLPNLELQFDSEVEDKLVESNTKELGKNLTEKLGDQTFYYEVFDPFHPEDDDPTQGWLIDDLTDIYSEIKNGILKIENGKPEYVEDGIWDIIFGRNSHWGNHAINALRALHYSNYN